MSRHSKAKKRRKKYNPLKRFQRDSGYGLDTASDFLRFQWDTAKKKHLAKELENIAKEFQESADEIYEEFKKKQAEKVSLKSKEELLSCEDWVFTTRIEECCYGKLDTFLDEFNLTHRREECLTNGFIFFNEILGDDGYSIASESIEYQPNYDKTIMGYFE